MNTLPDPIVGTWKVNLAKSKFSPGPAPRSHTRTYTETPQGIAFRLTGVAADGAPISRGSTFKYDGKDYPITGSPDYDVLALTRIDSNTVKSTQKNAGKAVGTITRAVSKDGKVMTLSSKGTSVSGSPYDNVLVFDKQ
jgi:hypothetical protein